MKLLREPLVHFMAIGVGLFVLFRVVDGEVAPTEEIVVSRARIAQLVEIFSRTWQRPPTEQEVAGLVEDHIREEVYYREALAMGLDRDDTIVRRRLRQKLEFVTEDLVDAVEPRTEDLDAYFREHSDSFRVADRISFRHIYFDRDRGGEGARRDAEALLLRLAGSDREVDPARFGDSLLLPASYDRVSELAIGRDFGQRFAQALAELPVGRWSGPVESGFGIHLVLIHERESGKLPALEEVRGAVEREWRNARRQEESESFYRGLRERYVVRIDTAEDDESGANPHLAEMRR